MGRKVPSHHVRRLRCVLHAAVLVHLGFRKALRGPPGWRGIPASRSSSVSPLPLAAADLDQATSAWHDGQMGIPIIVGWNKKTKRTGEAFLASCPHCARDVKMY